MKSVVDMIVVIPVGPTCRQEYIEDTVESVIHHTRATFKIILADDSQKGTGALIRRKYPAVDVVVTGTSMGKLCGLYVTLSLAYSYALDHYQFKVVLRMDTDALIIGKAPEEAAIHMFLENPGIGIAGQYPFDYNGNKWDTSWPRGQIVKYTRTYKFFKKPVMHTVFLMHYLRALRKGYRTGESVFGGACFISADCLRTLHNKKLLPDYRLKDMILEEDHLFAILVMSCGFRLGDLSSGSLPFGCAWLGLPASPNELIENEKKVIHSVRYHKAVTENEIRDYFRKKRKTNTADAKLSQITW